MHVLAPNSSASVSNFNGDHQDHESSPVLKIQLSHSVTEIPGMYVRSIISPHRRRIASYSYLAVGIVQLAAVTPNDSERVPPVRALHVGVKLVLRQRSARRALRCGRRSDRSGRSRRH